MGAQMRASLWWSGLLLISLAVARGAEVAGEGHLIVPPQLQRQHLKFLRRLSKVALPSGLPVTRRLLQSDDPLCFWDDNTCRARYLPNAPDSEISGLGESDERCLRLSSLDDCLDDPQCIWDETAGEDLSPCVVDFLQVVQVCMQPEFMVFIRSEECPSLSREANCLSLPGCQWNETDATCQPDEAAVDEAIGPNSTLASALNENAECLDSSPCVSPCSEDDLGDCVYPPFLDFSTWFLPTATSRLCQYLKMDAECFSTLSDSACSGACGIDNEGDCALTDEASIEFLFGSSEEEKGKWLDAAEDCSEIDDQDDCSSFTAGK